MRLEKHPADEMTPIERKKSIEQGKEIDRVPCVPCMGEIKCQISDMNIRDFWHNSHKMVEAEIRTFNRLGHDRLMIGPNSYGISDVLGAEVIYPKHGLPYIKKPILDTYEQLNSIEAIEVTTNKRIKPFLEAAQILGEMAQFIVPVEASVGGPFTIAANLRGVESLLRDLRKDPENVHRLLRIVTDSQKSCMKEATKHGLGIALADPVSSPDLIGAKYYQEFAFPYMKELTDYACSLGHKASLHMCGKTYRIWKYFRQYEVNEVSLDNMIDLKRAVEELSDAIPIAGNVPPVDVVMNGSKEDIVHSVQECIQIGSQAKKGYVLTTGCEIPLHTEIEKIDWLMEAVRNYS